MDSKEIWESIRLEKELDSIVKEILSRYNTDNPQGLYSALRQAAWVGMCTAKNWN